MNKLYLVGAAHLDIDAYKRLERFLVTSQPAAVGIEDTENDFRKTLTAAQHPDAIQFSVNNWQSHFQSCNTQTVTLLVENVVYKILLIGQYLHGGKLLFCDNPAVVESPAFEGALAAFITKRSSKLEELVRMSPEQLRQDVAHEYAQQSYPVSDNTVLVQFYSTRDAFAEQVLRQQLLKPTIGPIVNVGGLDHIYGDYYPNLFDRLADSNPVRMKLSETDKLPAV